MNFNDLSESDESFLLDHLRDMREQAKKLLGDDYRERPLTVASIEDEEKEELIELFEMANEDYRDYEDEAN
jgi:hypothetical protein